MENINATVDAIAILRDLKRWQDAPSVGQQILCRAYMRLEREATAHLTGKS